MDVIIYDHLPQFASSNSEVPHNGRVQIELAVRGDRSVSPMGFGVSTLPRSPVRD